jgi:hypothetical protein
MKSQVTVHHTRKPLKLLGPLLLILPAVSLPAGTQADAANSKTAQAVLHIQVQVVPVAQLPLADRLTSHGPVVYNILTGSPQMDVIKETRRLPAGAAGVSGAGAGRDAWLETVTVVPR